MRPFTYRKTIGVLGLMQSGKTVLLTSLIDHLKKHNPNKFPLFNGKTRMFELRENRPDNGADKFSNGVTRFRYESNRRDLVQGNWPAKTLEPAEYRATYLRSDWGWTEIELTFRDLPGERIGDMIVAGNNHYAGWSNMVLELFDQTEFKAPASEYLSYLKAMNEGHDQLDPDQLIHQYRRCMAKFLSNWVHLITPSTFLINAQGEYIASATRKIDTEEKIEQLAKEQLSGFSSKEQFAPLSDKLCLMYPQIASQFEQHYQTYRKKMVLPLANAFASCDDLLILVDIPTLLVGGSRMLNANIELLKVTLSCINPGVSTETIIWRWLVKYGSFKLYDLRSVRRIAFIATKADLIHTEDMNRLEDLLKELTEQHVSSHKAARNLDVQYSVCAAVKSTESEPMVDKNRWLQMRTLTGEISRVNVSQVPGTWPTSWQPNQFQFAKAKPHMPESNIKPPEHINLHRVAEFILE